MAFIPVPNCAEIVMKGQLNGHDAFLTLGVERTTPFLVPGDLEPLLDVMQAWWEDELAAILGTVYAMPEIRATSLESASAPAVSRFGMSPAAGIGAGPFIQDNVAMVVTFNTDLRGRSYRGRNYVPGLAIGHLADSSHFAALSCADMSTVYTSLAALLEPIDCTHVVISRQHDNVVLSTGVPTPVTGYVARQKIGTMRRRVAGTGA